MAPRSHRLPRRAGRAGHAVLVLAGLVAMTSQAAAEVEKGGFVDQDDGEESAPVPRRPPLERPNPDLSFPEPMLPESSLRREREETGALDAFLGPVPKVVVVAEGTSAEAMQRVVAVENTRLGLATVGGNTLTPEDVRLLSRLPSVHLHFTAPLEAIHVEVAERIPSLRAVTVHVPEDRVPEESLAWRLTRLGAARRNVVLEGDPSLERLAALAAFSSGQVTIALPKEGFGDEQLALLAARSGGLTLVVPVDVAPAGIESLSGLSIEGLILETEGNRLRRGVLPAASALDARIVVRVDRDVDREDLRRLKGTPRLELLVWLADSPEVPVALTDLLAESEGRRPGLAAPKEEGSPTVR